MDRPRAGRWKCRDRDPLRGPTLSLRKRRVPGRSWGRALGRGGDHREGRRRLSSAHSWEIRAPDQIRAVPPVTLGKQETGGSRHLVFARRARAGPEGNSTLYAHKKFLRWASAQGEKTRRWRLEIVLFSVAYTCGSSAALSILGTCAFVLGLFGMIFIPVPGPYLDKVWLDGLYHISSWKDRLADALAKKPGGRFPLPTFSKTIAIYCYLHLLPAYGPWWLTPGVFNRNVVKEKNRGGKMGQDATV